MNKGLLIVGAGEFAEIAREYFERDTPRRVVAFAIDREYIKSDELQGLPVIALDEAERKFPPATHDAFVAVLSSRLNRDRARFFAATKKMGYAMATYASPRAFVDASAKLGENVFVFEENVIQCGCEIGDDSILWSGNHIGHRSKIGAHVFIASHVVVSGFCEIGDYCFFGVNAALGNHVKIGADCTVGAGAVVVKNLAADSIVQPPPATTRENMSRRFWRVK